MKKLLILGNFLVLTLALQAQTDYFLFIQSENNQAFYVQSEGKTLSSSAAGHLIIPGLRDTLYTLTIGFPKNQFPEQVFQVRINRKDGGYQLKNMGEGWALFNLQTLQLIKAQQTESKKQAISYGEVKKKDVFSTLMAGLVNDSAVLYTSIAKVEPVKQSSATSIPDTPVSNSSAKRDENPGPNPAASKSDTTAIKTEVAKVESPLQKDTSHLQRVAVKLDEPSRNDTLLAKTETTPVQDLKTHDSSVVPSRSDSARKTGTDTIAAEIAGQPENQKKDTPNNNDKVSKELPVPANDKKVDAPKPPSVTNDQAAETKDAPIKPLIVWFSEIETDRGIELVYFDMTVSDKTDTIRILIPREDTKKENKSDIEVKKEDEKTSAGKFFGKLFGKKDNNASADSSDKKKSKPRESSITVTTVENSKVVDTPSMVNQKSAPPKNEIASIDSQKQEKETNSSGNFFGRIFGKKNDKTPGDSAKMSSATVKVTTVEKKSSDSTSIRNKGSGDKDAAEVEKLKKAQEDEEKTSTQRFFGKLFGKKGSNSNVVKDTTDTKRNQSSTQSSVKVSPVPEASAGDNKEKGGVIVTNSDCHQFASDSELDKLRVRMLGEKDIDGQVTEARKLFKVKCLSTRQVQSLSTLFRTDEGKYKLFDAAYPYVSDSNNFRELVALLDDEYYINRFKAMVRM